jgi:hypothetical protein
MVLVVGYAALSIGCMDRKPAPVCPVPTELNETEAMIGGFEGVDMLVVVDNSISMSEEQAILATSFFPLINSLVNPLPGWAWPAADDLRVAIVTSDMGLSWGGNPYEEGDGWPGTNPCSESGDNGIFQSYGAGTSVNIAEGSIECAADATQCPTGWVCENIDDETNIGVCNDPDGDGTNQACPNLASLWAETTPDANNDDLAFQVSCLSKQGTTGCGFEQQLQSAARALTRTDQADFVREDALLAILVVSDEEDCSMEDGPGLFATDEIQGTGDGPSALNIACGENPEYLYDMEHYYTTFTNAKLSPNAVIFAGIVGVPKDDACQGTGDEIGGCNDHADMELEIITEDNSAGQPALYYRPACTRDEGAVQVTKALPGRRYVELATTKFERMSYLYSICNKDWGPAMDEISALIASNLAGTCYEKPLEWDPAKQTAKCDVVVEYTNREDCPDDFDDDDPTVIEVTGEDDVESTNILCTLPKLPAPRDCADIDDGDMAGKFGWFYCEHSSTEDFLGNCTDSVDNDGDGDADCDDADCQLCQICGGTDACTGKCKYMVSLTEDAEAAVKQLSISVQCIQQFSFEDPNCQEDTEEACSDEKDNDGNGVWDCSDDFEADPPHSADAKCCPMAKKENGDCELEDRAYDICEISSVYPDACGAAAALLECNLPPLP